MSHLIIQFIPNEQIAVFKLQASPAPAPSFYLPATFCLFSLFLGPPVPQQDDWKDAQSQQGHQTNVKFFILNIIYKYRRHLHRLYFVRNPKHSPTLQQIVEAVKNFLTDQGRFQDFFQGVAEISSGGGENLPGCGEKKI